MGGERRKRDVLDARRGVIRDRTDEERQAGSVIWRIIPAERASGNTHLGVICTHLDVAARVLRLACCISGFASSA